MEDEMKKGDMNEVKIDYIKNFVDNELDKIGVFEKLKKYIEEENEETEEGLVRRIKEAGIIDDIIDNIKNWGVDKPSKEDKGQRMIYLKLFSGKGFIDYINPEENSYFQFDILFLGQRFSSKKIPCGTEFEIEQGFLLDLNPLKTDVNVDFETLKKLCSPIHIVLIMIQGENRSIVATKNIEWRWMLCYGNWKMEAEMYSPTTVNKLNVGIINLQINNIPYIEKSKLLSERVIFERLNSEKKYETESAQDFINYSNIWWEDYKSIRPSHSSRIVKLYVPTEDRENYVYKPAVSLIEPISVGRSISTPFEAARFVSLIPFQRNENPGGQKIEVWQKTHTFLAVGKGDVEDHSVLLCNLLLGFGLDAYVTCGISINGPHIWVITRSKLDNKKYKVTFWESLTGQRIDVDDSKIFRFYKHVHCVFNNNSFYANIQAQDTVFNTLYVFEDDCLWKSVPRDKIESLVKYNDTPFLDVVNRDNYKIEVDIEKELKNKITKYRKSNIKLTSALEISTQWDNKLSYLITPALVNYEFERIANITFGNDEFKQSVKNYVPEGYTFKGFPLQISSNDPDKIFASVLSNDVGKDILQTRGDNTRFAVRCKIFPFPQDIYSIWVMIAVKFRPIK